MSNEQYSVRKVSDEPGLRACHRVMAQLRPHLDENAFVRQALRQMRTDGYQVAALEINGVVRSLAGFRYMENLFSGRHMYVDDLVTDEQARSTGCGAALLDWLLAQARAAGCQAFELDSGVQRDRAHRFYFRRGLHISSFHFRTKL